MVEDLSKYSSMEKLVKTYFIESCQIIIIEKLLPKHFEKFWKNLVKSHQFLSKGYRTKVLNFNEIFFILKSLIFEIKLKLIFQTILEFQIYFDEPKMSKMF